MTASPATFAYLDGALDRADHLRDDATALDALWNDAVVLRLDADGRAASAGDGGPPLGHASARGARPDEAVFLGMAGLTPWFALRRDDEGRAIEANDDADAAPATVDLRSAAASWPAAAATAFAQARAMLHWQARHRHCGVCGGSVLMLRAGWQGRCTRCGLDHYPRTDPAVIVAVSDGDRLLLGRQASWPPRRYSTLAGFVEPGESLEQAVAREVFEESGVRVRGSRYLASQPWPFPSSLMLGFIADADPDEPVVGDELEDARWFSADEIQAALRREASVDRADDGGVLLSPRLSISRWLIEHWHARHTIG